MIAPVLCFMIYTRTPPKLIEKSNIGNFTLFLSTALVYGILTYVASTHISVGTLNAVMVLSFIGAAFIYSLLKTYCLQEPFHAIVTGINVATIILMCTCIIFLTQPIEIFSGIAYFTRNPGIYTSLCNSNRFANISSVNTSVNEIVTDMYKSGSWIGYLTASAAGFVNILIVISFQRLIKHSKDANNMLFWMAPICCMVSITITCFQHGFIFPQNTLCLVILILHAATAGTAYYMGIFSMCYLPSMDVAILSGSILPVLFIFQFTFLRDISPTPTNSVAVIAAVVVLVVIVGKPLLQSVLEKKGYIKNDTL